MQTVQTKICGITNLADARYCASKGADYLGFVLYRESPRYVDSATAGDIIEWVDGPRPVAVFVDEEPALVNRIASEAGFGLVQLHGNESPEYCRKIDLPVIKAVRVHSDDTAESVAARMRDYASSVSSFLLDTYVDGVPGGTGQVFSWNVAAELSRDFPMFLAGGLNPSNIVNAVQTVRPVAIDVSSGVEESPGRKSFEAIDNLFSALATIREDTSDVR